MDIEESIRVAEDFNTAEIRIKEGKEAEAEYRNKLSKLKECLKYIGESARIVFKVFNKEFSAKMSKTHRIINSAYDSGMY